MSQIYSVKLPQIVADLGLEILHQGELYEETVVVTGDVMRPGLPLSGFYDYFDENRLQVIGRMECAYLGDLTPAQRLRSFEMLFSHNIPALIITRGIEPLPECLSMAKRCKKTLLRTQDTTSFFMSELIALLDNYLAPRITRHGVLVDVYGEGILLTGESGVGKSETAIELIKRGHRLIADDAVEMKRLSSKKLIGSAPESIRHYMEIRGLGIIDVRRLFGMSSVKISQRIDLVIHLKRWEDDDLMDDRLGIDTNYISILDVEVPMVTIPVKPGRSIASIVEVAAMNNRHKEMGYNAVEEFTKNIDRQMEIETQLLNESQK